MSDTAARLRTLGVIPVIALEDEAHALPLADALTAGGLPVAEITFRTAAAAGAIARIAAERPGVLVGAGTVLTVANLRAAQAAGAQFALAPGFNPEVVRAAQDLGILFVPGVATPSEIEQAMALGCTLLKLFPAEALGGIAYINALAGPYAHTGLGLVPTGGVTPGNLTTYLATPMVAAVGGTWLAKRDALAQGQWDTITTLAAEAMAAVADRRQKN
jgi:2-dehydro-3-deoxyphosphogluconate aldolase/(4S)-4-hydroxy-2-oxoglutarate aldolase